MIFCSMNIFIEIFLALVSRVSIFTEMEIIAINNIQNSNIVNCIDYLIDVSDTALFKTLTLPRTAYGTFSQKF